MPGGTSKTSTPAKTKRQPKSSIPKSSSSAFDPPRPAQPTKPNRITLILRSNEAHEGR
jgi:hypothetical protein